MGTRHPSVSPEWFVTAIRGIQNNTHRLRPFAVLLGLEQDGRSPVRDEAARQVGDMEKTLNAVMPTDESVAFAV